MTLVAAHKNILKKELNFAQIINTNDARNKTEQKKIMEKKFTHK